MNSEILLLIKTINSYIVISHGRKISANTIFNELKKKSDMTEPEFIKLLNILKKEYPQYYNKMIIPHQWNGMSHVMRPENYDGENKIRCVVRKIVNAQKIYPNTEFRYLYVNQIVYVPDSEVVSQLIDEGILERI